MVDWNSDDELDLISGDRNGYLNVFIRQSGTLTAYYQYKLMDSTVLDVGYNSQPAVVDWNGDGKKDLLIGSETGYIYFYPNQTSDSWPMFQDFSYVEVQREPINLYRINPYVFDLDRDGVNDLICGANDGYIHFYKNIGTNSEPQLFPPETLKTVNEIPIQPESVASGSRCGFGYWNSDTLPDFLLSGYNGKVELYLGAEMVGAKEPTSVLPNFNHLEVSPSPGKANVRISLGTPLTKEAQLTVTDVAGRRIRTVNLARSQNEFTWDVRRDDGKKVGAGVYFLRVTETGAEKVLYTGRAILIE